MTYELKFIPSALKEWKKLSSDIQKQFKKKLREIIQRPQVNSKQLSGYKNLYKIKLRSVGCRLVYEVVDREICVYVITVGKRDKNFVYKKLKSKWKQGK